MPKWSGHSNESKRKMDDSKKDENNPAWKGDKVKYRALHAWIGRKLGKPKICSDCGTTVAKCYEWANISGEYKRDLSDWKRLCKKCHIAFDNSCARGEDHGSSKLTEKEILEIRKIYVFGKYGYKRIAEDFNVCKNTIRKIITREIWKRT